MSKNLLVTGFAGFVAGSVIWQARTSWHVHALDIKETPASSADVEYYTIDLRDFDRLKEVFERIKPDAVIHTAAIADIDYCQAHQDETEAVNVGATANIARLCAKNATKMVLCSTDTVFDGEKGMYVEDDAPGPLNFYAETKVRAEEIVRSTVSNGVVTRLSLVVGLPVMGAGNSFLAKTIDKLKAGKPVKFPANEIRTPIDVITLGRALLELAENDFSGTIHLSGNERLNRHDMACRITRRLGYSPDLVVATNSNAMPGRAPRPDDVSLDNAKAKSILNTPMRTLAQGLDLILSPKEEKTQ